MRTKKNTPEALIFSIEEFATFDGPGIRTTVFLKGCPLHCMWCHNPEGQSFEEKIVRSPNGCLGCGRCLDEGERITGHRVLVEDSISVCPQNLVRRCGVPYSPQKLADHLRKTIPILNASGGGVTFSGGEPLAHPQFLLETMRLLHGETSLAVQTSGFAPLNVFKETLSLADYILMDLKLMDPKHHEYYTGEKNESILKNYHLLAQCGLPFITRVPLIPGITDTEENIEAIAAFMEQNGVRRVELLPYNKMAGSKYEAMGFPWHPEFDEQKEPETRVALFNAHGISVKIL